MILRNKMGEIEYNYTIIIPHYNIPRLLRRLLCSIPNHDDLQIIVVDDCSNKNIEELQILKEKFNYVKWLSTGTNGGGGKARNIGLKHAKGKYIIFADADDIFELEFKQSLEDYVDKDYDIIYFDGVSRDSETNELSNRTNHLTNYIYNYIQGSDTNASGLRYLFGEPWCKFIRRRIIEENQIRFDEIPIHNDTTFAYLIGFYCKKLNVDRRKIYCVTTRKGSVSGSIGDDKILNRIDVFSREEKFLTNNKINTFSREHYIQIVRLCAHLRFGIMNKGIKIMQYNGLLKFHIYKNIFKTFISIILKRI